MKPTPGLCCRAPCGGHGRRLVAEDLSRGIHECCALFDFPGAFGAFEIMRLKLLAQVALKLPEQVSFRRLQLYRFLMLHISHHPVVKREAKSFRPFRLPPHPSSFISLIFHIDGPEALFGSVQQHTQIIAIHAEFLANLVLTLLFQKDGPQEPPVLLG